MHLPLKIGKELNTAFVNMAADLRSKRLTKELKITRDQSSADFYVFPKDENLMIWKGFLPGPADTPYQKGAFSIEITLHDQYPVSPPKVRFLTKIFHPNINWETGEVCIDILKSEWSPVWSLIKLGKAISHILVFPNAESPLNCDAGNMIRDGDELGFWSTAELCVENYAINKIDLFKAIN